MARSLVLILVLVNVLVFLWGSQRPGPVQDTLPPLPQGVGSLYLVGEDKAEIKNPVPVNSTESSLVDTPLPAHPEPEVQSLKASQNPLFLKSSSPTPDPIPITLPEKTLRCLELGPFPRQTDAAQLLWNLSEKDLKADIRTALDKKTTGYWVLMFPEKDEVKAIFQKLKASNIQDIQLLSQGEFPNALSLGLYSDQAQAEKRRNQLLEQGFKSEIRSRITEEFIYWIQLKYPEGNTELQGLLERLFETYPSLNFPPSTCHDIATS